MPKYYYTEIPGIIPHPFPGDEKLAGPPIFASPRLQMEHMLVNLKITAYRADLVDGRRVFRTEPRFMPRMRKDVAGYFIEINKTKFYWTGTSPVTENDAYTLRWGPL